jgi:tRNA pseudouridine38-40 synthase
VFVADQSCYIPQELNIQKMNEAASYLIGTQDFTSFSKLHTDVKTNMCTVYKARWEKCADDQCYFEISADRFLRNMVRATVGTLLDVGRGKLDPKDLHVILGKKDRGEASVSAPAHGLFLWEIVY